MSDSFLIKLDGKQVAVTDGMTVAAAILNHGWNSFRRSISGQQRGPLCGMGICFECRVVINQQLQQRSCQRLCQPGMEVETEHG